MKLVRMARLVHAPTRGDSRIDAYRDVEIATPLAQDSVVTSEAGVGVSRAQVQPVHRTR